MPLDCTYCLCAAPTLSDLVEQVVHPLSTQISMAPTNKYTLSALKQDKELKEQIERAKASSTILRPGMLRLKSIPWNSGLILSNQSLSDWIGKASEDDHGPTQEETSNDGAHAITVKKSNRDFNKSLLAVSDMIHSQLSPKCLSQHFAQSLDQWETSGVYKDTYLYLIWTILGLKKNSDGTNSTLPAYKEISHHSFASSVYIIFLYRLLDVLASTFGLDHPSKPPTCLCDQEFLNSINEGNFLSVSSIFHSDIMHYTNLILGQETQSARLGEQNTNPCIIHFI